MENKKLLLIVNPCSGRAKMYTELLKVVEVFSSNNYLVTVYPTKFKGDATEFVKKISADDFDTIVVCGGDGTLNEVIEGIMESNKNIPLGYIPSGTLNEWSSGLNISRNIETAAKDIINGKKMKLDIGRFNEKYFSYTASFGAFTGASYSTPQEMKNVLGQSAYFLEGIKGLAAIKPIHMKLTNDDGVVEGDFLFGAISNSLSVGSIIKYDKTPVGLNDGIFEVILIHNPDNIVKLQPLVDGILKHEFNREGMEFFRTNKLTIETTEEVAWTLDGEYAKGNGLISLENIHGAITFIIPEI